MLSPIFIRTLYIMQIRYKFYRQFKFSDLSLGPSLGSCRYQGKSQFTMSTYPLFVVLNGLYTSQCLLPHLPYLWSSFYSVDEDLTQITQ